MADNTYQTDIAVKQGGDAFLFFGNEVSATTLEGLLYRAKEVQTIANSAGVLSTVTVPNVGTVIYSLATAASNASALIGGCVAGEEKIIFFKTTGAAASVLFSTVSGVILYGWIGEVSSIAAHGSAASNPIIRLRGIDTDTWAIVDTAGQVTLNLSA
jgi:hypothetical protein